MAILYRTYDKLFNLKRLQVRTKVKEETVRDFLFADDCAVNASSEEEMQRNMNKYSSERKRRSYFSQHPSHTAQIRP